MAREVKRADGKVWIEGMEGVNWGGSFFTREDSQVRCLVEALRCAGRDVSYADVMGMSGAAFKLTMEPNLFVAEIHSEMGMDWQEIVSRVWGADYQWKAVSCSDEENPGWRQHLHDAAVESIGRGMPLFYMNGEWNLLVGYLEDGSGFICKPYAGDESGYQEMVTPGGFLGDIWFASVLRPRAKPADRRESVVRSLQAALELADKPAEGDGKRLFGSAAYEAWIAAVESGGDDVSLHGNAFSYSQLLTSRQAGAEYLRSVAAELGEDAAPRLRAAADRYQAIYQRLWDGQACVMWPWEENWTPDNRAKQAGILRDCLADEKAAIAEIEAALCALGEDVPQPVQQGGSAMGPEGPHMLEGLEHPKRTAAELACVEGALRYLGKDMSAAWLYGGTGHAFAINMRPTVCVSSPYAWRKTLYELAPNLGFRVEGFNVSRAAAGDSFPARQREAWDMVRAAIDRGQPCYADRVYWMPDYALITGYDDVGYYYAHWDDRGGPTPWQKLGTEDIEVLDVWRVELCEGKPDDQVVRAALETVLARAATPHGWTMNRDQASGPWAFDMWADELAAGRALRDSHAYNACFWAEYREMAVAFVEEAKRRLPGRCDAAFDEAIAHYRVVRDRLAAVAELTPNRDDANWTDTLRSPESAELIRQAGAEERQGLVALAKIVRALGGTVPAAADPGPQETATSRRFVLQGVPKVAHYTDGRWRFTPFAHALDAALRYLGQEEQYDYLMCTSGAMFRMAWAPKAWDGGNSDILGMAEQTLEPMRRAFRSAGYEMRAVAKAEPTQWAEELLCNDTRRLGGELTDEAGFRRRIVESINAGRPVIAFGVIGPPEACLLTGYDERGDVLIGWNVFQDQEKTETEPNGYFRVRDWYPKTRGLLLFGDRAAEPDPKELDRETLQWALQVLRTPRVRDHQAGPAAFEAWAADMLDDASFPKDDLKVLHERLMCHWDSMTVTATRGSGSATAYLLSVAERDPAMAEHLRAAADCLDREDVVHGVAPGEEARLARLADPKVRREVANSILAAGDMHVKAAEHIEAALRAAGAAVGPADVGGGKHGGGCR